MPIELATEIPGPKTREALEHGRFDMQAGYRALIIDDAACHGCYLVDVDGNAILDMFSSFALGALGYNHPRLLAAAKSPEMARALANPTSTPFVTTRGWLQFAERVAERYAPEGMHKMYCVDAGGEAVESAIKAAYIVHGEDKRAAAGAPRDPLALDSGEHAAILANRAGSQAVVVSFGGAFHGRGLGPMSATHSKPIHKADLPCFDWPLVPFPANRFPLEAHAEENDAAEAASLDALRAVLGAHEGNVAAVLIEVVQCEGGDRYASAGFFAQVQRLARAAGAALIIDEVQTGVGVTGTLWAHEALGLEQPPDMVVFGKKMQLGGFFASERYDITQFGRMYQTRNGDRARALLALATLEAIEHEGLLSHVRDEGGYFVEQLGALAARHHTLVSQARGRGFLLAFDMPTPELRNAFLLRARQKGVMASYTGTRSVRLRPHLITARSEIDEAVAVFDAALAELETQA